MMWMIPLATAAMGAMNAQKKQEQQEAHNKAQAELTRYSPWTGMKGQLDFSAPSMMGGAMQGGVAGLGMAQGIQGMQGGAPGAAMSAGADVAPSQASDVSYLGTGDKASQLGKGMNAWNFQAQPEVPNMYASNGGMLGFNRSF